MSQYVIDDWSELKLNRVALTVVKQLEADSGMTLADAILRAQEQYIPLVDRLTKAEAMAYTKHNERLSNALKAAGVIYPNRAAGIKVGLQASQRAQQIAAKFPDLIKKTPDLPPVPKLFTLEEAMKELTPKITELVARLVKSEVNLIMRDEKKSNVVPIVDKRIKVLVVSQHHMVLADLQRQAAQHANLQDLEFRIWKDEGLPKLRQWLHWADGAFVMTEHVSHETLNVVKTFTQTKNVLVAGSTGALIRTLNDYYSPGERIRQEQKQK